MSAKVYFNASSLDIAAKGYFTAIKDALKPEKFHIQPPTPQLLRKAQKAAGELRRPIPRDAQGRILPHPSRGTKSDIFRKEDFKEVDNHALNAPDSLLTANIEELVDYLVSPFENDDVSTVRAIFRWISGQDLRYYENKPEVSSDCAAYYLNELKKGKGRYDKLFNLMCEHARIPSATISGHSKGIGYNVGDPLSPSTRNMWNAVLLGQDWYLIDVHWASRKVSGVEAEEWQLIEFNRQQSKEMSTPQDIYEFDEFYFLTDPEEFIYSHFPDKEVWQLLARPMTHAEFQKVILLKPKFFQFNLKVKSHPWCTLKSVDGAVNIELTTEREDLSFSYELYRSTKVNSGQQRLQKYLFLERNPEEKKVCIEINFPTAGKFKAEIYAKDSRSKLEWLCSYVLYCEKPEPNCMPLPTNQRSEWGPGADMKMAGIIPLTHKRGKIFVDSVETQVNFQLKFPVELIAQLMTVNEENLDNYVLLGVMDDTATVYVRIPQKGQYALCIFAKTEPNQQQFVNICNYLIKCSEDFGKVKPYPQTTNSRVGPLDTFHKLGLKMNDHLSGLVSASRDGTFTFSVLVPEGIEYFPKLTLSTKDDFSEYVDWYRCDGSVNFSIRFPNAGFYKFNLFAKSEHDEGGYPEVLCLVLEVVWPMVDCLPFPKKFASYKDIYRIVKPNQRLLAIGKIEKVNVFLPDAEEVAFIDGGSWTRLVMNENGMWEGQITPVGTAETISMAANLSETGAKFSAITSFEVISEKDLNHIFLAQKLSREEADQEYLEQMSLQNNASKKSQGNGMMNQIQRIAKMKQQNLDDEMLQRIQSEVGDNDFEILALSNNEIAIDLLIPSENYNFAASDNYNDYVNDHIPHVTYDQISEEEEENEESEEENEDGEEKEQFQISDVDINLNDIKDKINETDIVSQIETEICAENASLNKSGHFIIDSHTNLKESELPTPENISHQSDHVQDDYIKEYNLENQQISKTEQSLLEKCTHPEENITGEFNELNDFHNEFFPMIPRINEEFTSSIKPEHMHWFNAAPPPPPSPEDDFTEQLIKKVSEMEKSVEKEELALKHFSYKELKGTDENVLRQRPLASQPVTIDQAAAEDKGPAYITRPSVEVDQEDEEVPLIKFVEYFIYSISLLSILFYVYRLLSWRPY